MSDKEVETKAPEAEVEAEASLGEEPVQVDDKKKKKRKKKTAKKAKKEEVEV